MRTPTSCYCIHYLELPHNDNVSMLGLLRNPGGVWDWDGEALSAASDPGKWILTFACVLFIS